MAPVAPDQPHLRSLFREVLQPAPDRMRSTLKLAVICSATVLLTMIYQTPEPSLAAYVVFFLNKPDRTTSIILGLGAPILVAVIVFAMVILTNAVIDDPALRLVAMGAVSLVVLYLGAASKLAPVAPILSLVIAYALTLLGAAQVGELATRAFMYAWLFVAIPALATIVVNLVAGPAPDRLIEIELARRLNCAAAVLRGATKARRNLWAMIDDGNASIEKYLKFARIERTCPQVKLKGLRNAGAASAELLLLTDVIARLEMQPETLSARLTIAETLEQMANLYQAGKEPVTIEIEIELVCRAGSALAKLCGLLQGFGKVAALQEKKEKRGFLAADFFENPAYGVHAAVTTLAAMSCYLIYSALDWDGIHTAMITCYIVSLGTVGQSVEKLMLRIAGSVFGAALGMLIIVFVTPDLETIGGLLVVVCVSAFASAWVATGSERISYFGFQMAFALFICELQGSGPGYDMVLARDRILGILLGNTVFFLFCTAFWPTSVAARLPTEMAKAIRSLASLSLLSTIPLRRDAITAGQGELGKIEETLSLLQYEPRSVRPAVETVKGYADVLRDLKRLLGSLTAAGGDRSSGWSARLEGLADRAEAGQIRSVEIEASDEMIPGTLNEDIERSLARLEAQFDISWINEAEVTGYAGA